MRCEKCDHDNDAGASMCAGCGAYLRAPEPADTRPPLSEFAESALTLAVISPLLLGLTALLALPVGVVGLVEVRRSSGRLRGTGHAIAAIIISLVVLAIVAGLAFYVVGNPFPGACEDCRPQAMGGDGGKAGATAGRSGDRPLRTAKTTATTTAHICRAGSADLRLAATVHGNGIPQEVHHAHGFACLMSDDRAGRIRARHAAA